MKNIYTFRVSDDYEESLYGFAESSKSVDPLWIYQGHPLKEDEINKEWQIPTFKMLEGKFPDFLDNDCSWVLCSKKMKEIIENNANNSSSIKWLPVKIYDGKSLETYYAALIEYYLEDIIDFNKSKKLKNGEIYLPHFKYENIKKYDLFAYENDNTSFFISEKLKNILEMSDLRGLDFEDWYAS